MPEWSGSIAGGGRDFSIYKIAFRRQDNQNTSRAIATLCDKPVRLCTDKVLAKSYPLLD
jgi:hypothetical protein